MQTRAVPHVAVRPISLHDRFAFDLFPRRDPCLSALSVSTRRDRLRCVRTNRPSLNPAQSSLLGGYQYCGMHVTPSRNDSRFE